jgi:hypothetical protein
MNSTLHTVRDDTRKLGIDGATEVDQMQQRKRCDGLPSIRSASPRRRNKESSRLHVASTLIS